MKYNKKINTKVERGPLGPSLMLFLALIGIAEAFYVSHASYTGQLVWSAGLEGANTVIKSPHSRIFNVPMSYFGLIFYLYMFGLSALLAFDPFSSGLRFGALLYTIIGVCFSIYAMYLQLSLIHALCLYCLISAVTTLLLLIIAALHFRAARIPTVIA
jgi:uncharacterized membrane protein